MLLMCDSNTPNLVCNTSAIPRWLMSNLWRSRELNPSHDACKALSPALDMHPHCWPRGLWSHLLHIMSVMLHQLSLRPENTTWVEQVLRKFCRLTPLPILGRCSLRFGGQFAYHLVYGSPLEEFHLRPPPSARRELNSVPRFGRPAHCRNASHAYCHPYGIWTHDNYIESVVA